MYSVLTATLKLHTTPVLRWSRDASPRLQPWGS